MRSRQFLENTATLVPAIFDSSVSVLHARAVFAAPRHSAQPFRVCGLFRVELDDQLLADGHGEVFTRRHALDAPDELLLVELQPLRHATALDRAHRLLDALDLAALLTH